MKAYILYWYDNLMLFARSRSWSDFILLLILAFTLNRWALHSKLEGVDFPLESIHKIREALPEIWEADGESSENVRRSC